MLRDKFFTLSMYNKIWLIVSLLFILTASLFEINHSYWGDEFHFVETVRLFESSSLPDIIKDYPEVTTPLVYIVYALWGKLFGVSLITLRILSLIISFSFLMILYNYVAVYIKNEKLSLILCCAVIINPYMWGLSVFVFTDMLALLFVFTALYLFKLGKPGMTSLFLGLSILCRQYTVIFIAALWIFVLIKSINSNENRIFLKYTVYIVASSLPFIFLVILWGGISPRSGLEKFTAGNDLSWNTHAFTTYVSFSALYILPLLLFFNKRLLIYKRFLIPAVIAGCIYFFSPVEVSEVTRIQNNINTVGQIHKLINALAGVGITSDIILYVFFSLGLWILMIFVKEDIIAVRSGSVPYFILLSGIFYCFLMIMPFSYQIWEKYLVMIIPVISLRLGFLFADY